MFVNHVRSLVLLRVLDSALCKSFKFGTDVKDVVSYFACFIVPQQRQKVGDDLHQSEVELGFGIFRVLVNVDAQRQERHDNVA